MKGATQEAFYCHTRECAAKFWCSKQHGNQDIKNWYETMKQNRESGVDPSSGSQQRHQEKAWEKAVLTAGLSGAAVHPCAE